MTARPESSLLLELRQVNVVSPRTDAVMIAGVNWRVHTGNFWVIGGLPGMGKSALLETTAGILPPGAGEVWFFGHPLDALSETEFQRVRLRVSLLFEGGGRLFAQMTTAENVALPYCYHHNCSTEQAGERLKNVLEWMELSEYAACLPASVPRALSPRIGLARALITGPEALLLDNPLHGLDPREQAWWLAMLARLAHQPGPCQSQPLTLVVAADTFNPWLELGTQFVAIKNQAFIELGNRAALETGKEAVLHDLLAPGAGSG